MKRYVPLIALCVLLSSCGKEEAPPVASAAATETTLIQPAKIDAALGELVESNQLIGASALVFEKGREAYFGAFGLADRENKKLMRRDTLARIYSMTKPVTGAALMVLFDEGKFELDDPIEKYAPEFANLRVFAGTDANGKPKLETLQRSVTIRDLLRHTAGLSSGNPATDSSPIGEMYRAANPTRLDNTLEQMAKEIGQVPLLYQPGTRWLYSHAVDVQAFLVERLSGQRYDEFLRARILDPLKMTNTRYTLRPEDRERLAQIYMRADDGTFSVLTDDDAVRINEKEWPMKPGGYGLVTTLDDFMRFARMLLNEGELDGVRVLSATAVELMRTNAMPAEVTDTSWLPSKGRVGFGIDVAVRIAPPANSAEASGAVGEYFWDGFGNTLFWVDPENEIAAVLFTQYVPFGRVPLHKNFRDAVYELDAESSAINKPATQDEDPS
jgi:CubicO group peptidase (beta-lactamase class C family)